MRVSSDEVAATRVTREKREWKRKAKEKRRERAGEHGMLHVRGQKRVVRVEKEGRVREEEKAEQE